MFIFLLLREIVNSLFKFIGLYGQVFSLLPFYVSFFPYVTLRCDFFTFVLLIVFVFYLLSFQAYESANKKFNVKFCSIWRLKDDEELINMYIFGDIPIVYT